MVLEDLPYDYPLICPSGSSHDVRVGSMLRSSLSLPSRYLESTSPYIPGDPLKSLDWRILARRDEWMVRRHHPFTQRHYGLIVDGSSAMHWPDKAFIRAHHLEDISKWQVAMRIACHLSYHLSGGGREMDVVLWNPPDSGPEEGPHGSSGSSPSAASYALRRLRRPEDAARCYNILTQESSSASQIKRWWPTEEQYENRSIPPSLYPWEFFDAAFAQQQHWLLITDAINSHTRLLIKRHPQLRIIHLLSRLELDSSWLKTSFHYRCSPLSSQIYHGKKKLRSSARKALDHLLRSSALRQSQHCTSLNSQSTLELYLENLREVL